MCLIRTYIHILLSTFIYIFLKNLPFTGVSPSYMKNIAEISSNSASENLLPLCILE